MLKLSGTTLGDRYGQAMEIQTQIEADQWLEVLIAYEWGGLEASEQWATREHVESVVRSNLSYYSGYYPKSTQERVNQLFKLV